MTTTTGTGTTPSPSFEGMGIEGIGMWADDNVVWKMEEKMEEYNTTLPTNVTWTHTCPPDPDPGPGNLLEIYRKFSKTNPETNPKCYVPVDPMRVEEPHDLSESIKQAVQILRRCA